MELTKQIIINDLEKSLSTMDKIASQTGFTYPCMEPEMFLLNEISNNLALLTQSVAIIGKSIIAIKMLDQWN